MLGLRLHKGFIRLRKCPYKVFRRVSEGLFRVVSGFYEGLKAS